MRNSMRSSAPRPTFRSGVARCTATAQRTASTTLGKFEQHAVTGGLDNAAVMLGELRIDELAAQRFEALERALLVRPHQPPTSAARIAARRRVAAIPSSAEGIEGRHPKPFEISHVACHHRQIMDYCGGGNHRIRYEINGLSLHQTGPAAESACVHRQDIVRCRDIIDPALDNLSPSAIPLPGVFYPRLKFSQCDC